MRAGIVALEGWGRGYIEQGWGGGGRITVTLVLLRLVLQVAGV